MNDLTEKTDEELAAALHEINVKISRATDDWEDAEADMDDARERQREAGRRLKDAQAEAEPFDAEVAFRRHRDAFGEPLARMIAKSERAPEVFEIGGLWYLHLKGFVVLLPVDEKPVGSRVRYDVAGLFAQWFAAARPVEPGSARGVSQDRSHTLVRMVDGRGYPDEQIALVDCEQAEYGVAELRDDDPVLCIRVDAVPVLACAPISRTTTIVWEDEG